MNKSFIILFLLLAIAAEGCQERIWDNPFDPECPKEVFTPSSFSAIKDGFSIKLSWEQTNLLISGFEIYRSYDDIIPIKVATPGKDVSTWTDSSPIPGKLMHYKIVAIAGTNRSNETSVSFIGPAVPSKVTTTEFPSVFLNHAIVSGIIEEDGGSIVSTRGICWNTAPNPTISHSISDAGSGLGIFTSTLNSLAPNTKYYARAYSTTSAGTSYGNEINFTTYYGELFDSRDGKTYLTVKIGDQIWMAENLAYLPKISPSNQGSESIPYYYVYDYQGTNVSSAKATDIFKNYGVLYNQPAALISCPTGWHLPNESEWAQSINFLIENGYNYDGSLTGNKVAKSIASKLYWNESIYQFAVGYKPSLNNKSNFSALPGGGRYEYDGSFHDILKGSNFWSSSLKDDSFVLAYSLSYTGESLHPAALNVSSGFSVRCLLGSNETPKVKTNLVKETTFESAVLGGNVIDDGFATIIERGIVYGTTPNPTLANNKVLVDGTLGDFSTKVSGLENNKTYYARAYATNRLGTSYGDQVNFILYLNLPDLNVTDINGNIYKTVRIGNQTWLAENLKVTKYRDGTDITNVTDGTIWSGLTNGAWCDFANNPSFGAIYGHLYNFYAVIDTRHLCPQGWHVPTDLEWSMLGEYLGGKEIAGGKLKNVGTSHWTSPNIGADNSSGFTALAGSWRGDDGAFYYWVGDPGVWWTSSEVNNNTAWFISLHSGNTKLKHDYGDYFRKKGGLSIRCLKD